MHPEPPNSNNIMATIVNDPLNQVTKKIMSILDSTLGGTAGNTNRRLKFKLSVIDLQGIINQVSQAIRPLLINQQVEEWLEANCADYLAMIADASTSRTRNSHSSLSPMQLTKVHDQIVTYSNRIQDAEKRKCARCVMAAALYRVYHNEGEFLAKIKSMLKPPMAPKNGTLAKNVMHVINEDSEEFIRRRSNLFEREEQSQAVDQRQTSAAASEVESASTDLSPDETKSQCNQLLEATHSACVDLQNLPLSSKHDQEDVSATISELTGSVNALQPIKVAVVGEMSSGKSTFLSYLLDCPGFLRADNGSTTAVITEMQFAPTKTFKASIIFKTSEEHKSDKEYYTANKVHRDIKSSAVKMNENGSDGAMDNDEKLSDIEGQLSMLYEYDFDGEEVAIFFDKPRKSCDDIGRPPLVLEADSLEVLGNLLKEEPVFKVEKQDDDDDDDDEVSDNPAVKLVKIEGPFKNIPAGVVLLDTPGLGDAKGCRSYRTLDYLRYAHVVWYASPVEFQMNRDWDHKVVVKIKELGNLTREFHIIATKADGEKDRSEEVVSKYLKQLLLAYCTDYLAASRRVNVTAQTATTYIRRNLPEVYQSLKAQAEKVCIQFTTNRDPSLRDFQPWRELLQHYGKQYQELLVKQQELIGELAKRYDYSGMGLTGSNVLRAQERKFQDAIRRLRAAIDDALSSRGEKLPALINAIVAHWNSFGAGTTTRMAIMHPNRAGEFIGKKKAVITGTFRYDLNHSMAREWHTVIDPAWNLFLAEISDIQGTLSHIPERGSLASNLHQQIISLGEQVFEIDVKSFFKKAFSDMGVFQVRRSTFPNIEELQNVLSERLRAETDKVVGRVGGTQVVEGFFSQQMRIVLNNLSVRSVAVDPAVKEIMRRLALVTNCTTPHTSSATASRSREDDTLPSSKRSRAEGSSSNQK